MLVYLSYRAPLITVRSGSPIRGQSSYRPWRNICVFCNYLSPSGRSRPTKSAGKMEIIIHDLILQLIADEFNSDSPYQSLCRWLPAGGVRQVTQPHLPPVRHAGDTSLLEGSSHRKHPSADSKDATQSLVEPRTGGPLQPVAAAANPGPQSRGQTVARSMVRCDNCNLSLSACPSNA
jgi:hypothetical protein